MLDELSKDVTLDVFGLFSSGLYKKSSLAVNLISTEIITLNHTFVHLPCGGVIGSTLALHCKQDLYTSSSGTSTVWTLSMVVSSSSGVHVASAMVSMSGIFNEGV